MVHYGIHYWNKSLEKNDVVDFMYLLPVWPNNLFSDII